MSLEFKPAPYSSDQFVGREDELRLVAERVKQACRGEPINQAIVHFHCVPRAGKTWLLNHLAHVYRCEPRPVSGGKEVIVVLVDCAALAAASDVRSRLLEALAKPFKVKFPQWRSQAESGLSLGDFAARLQEWGGGLMPLFLFDGAEHLDADDFAWLETSLLEPLVRSDRTVVVVSGRATLPRWQQAETRRRRHDRTLQPFSADETAEQGRKRGFLGSIQDLYRYAHGHPYLTQLLTEATDCLGDAQVSAAVEHVESELLRNIPIEWREVVRSLAVFRQLNFGTVRDFLSGMMWADYAKRSEAFFLGDFFQKILGDLLDWSRESYYLVPVARRVLLQRLRLLDPDLYQQSHRVALQLYERWLKRYRYNGARWLREIIYCRTGLAEAPEYRGIDLEADLTGLLDRYLTPEFVSTDQAVALEHDLRDDQMSPERLSCSACYEVLRRQLRQYIQKVSTGT